MDGFSVAPAPFGVDRKSIIVENEAVYTDADIEPWNSVSGKLIRNWYVKNSPTLFREYGINDPTFDDFILVKLPKNIRGILWLVVSKNREI